MALPLLVVVSGPPGSGKTTLAHALGRTIPCPAICRDEIKEGLVHAMGSYRPAPGDDLSQRTLDVFFGVVGALVDAEVSLVAEAAFQHRLWEPGLTPLLGKARVGIVQCRVEPEVAWQRINGRSGEIPAGASSTAIRRWTRRSRASPRSSPPSRPRAPGADDRCRHDCGTGALPRGDRAHVGSRRSRAEMTKARLLAGLPSNGFPGSGSARGRYAALAAGPL